MRLRGVARRRSSGPRWAWWLVGAAFVACVAVLVVVAFPGLRLHPITPDRPSTAPSGPTTPLPQGLGTYASAVTRPDGSMDVERTVEALQAVGADHYYYLIWDRVHPGEGSRANVSSQEWAQLPDFASRAAKANISVTVYLVPPSESNAATYLPYGWDYPAWFRAVGQVAKEHPNIRGIALDDFAANTPGRSHAANHQPFTAGDVRSMVGEARKGAPWLRFYAVVYSQDVVSPTGMLPAYRDVVDGVIFAFAGPRQYLHAPQNTTDPAGAFAEAQRVRRLTECRSSTECLQLTFPPPRLRAAIPQRIQLERIVDVGSGPSRTLKLAVLDDRSTQAVGGYAISVSIDGHSTALSRASSAGWTSYTAAVPTSVRGTVALRVTVDARLGSKGFATFLDDAAVSGPDIATQLPARGWQVSGSSGTGSQVVRRLDLVFLVYCAPFGRESGLPGAADARYVSRVLSEIAPLVREGALDGVVAYRLNLERVRSKYSVGDPAAFEVVREAYGRYRRDR